MIPVNTDLVFEIDVVGVDGKSLPEGQDLKLPPCARPQVVCSNTVTTLSHPWWLARVQRPSPSAYFLNVCRHVARGVSPDVLARARPIPRKTREETIGWDLMDGACVISGVQDG